MAMKLLHLIQLQSKNRTKDNFDTFKKIFKSSKFTFYKKLNFFKFNCNRYKVE